ncbi:MAG: porin family protein [Gammaproteobacteria bacterium]|nr:porin family protein [Gammaproteobacteria bacterium]MDH5800040.1 porin family protein [Gammaproteobacteria bacterium]
MSNCWLRYGMVVLLLGIPVAAHSQNVVAPLMGVSSWNEDTFDINGVTIVLDTDNAVARGVEFAHIFATGLRLGGQAQYQQVDVLSSTATSRPGYADIFHVNLLVSYYIPVHEVVKPYFGVGMGSTQISFHGGPMDTLDGDSYFGKAGLELKIADRVAWTLGAKARYFKVRDDNATMKTNTVDYFMGLNFYTRGI